MAARDSELEERLGYRFTQTALLAQSLTHRSYSAQHYERLEFIGDGILNCIVGLMLYERYPEMQEGHLSRLRANLVNQTSLHEIALEIRVGRHLRLGEGEVRSGGRERPSILADAMEALMGAVFLDGGFAAVRNMVEGLFASKLAAINPTQQGKDAKTQLQEWLQSRRHPLPVYQLMQVSGQAHAQTFEVECRVEPLGLATRGSGQSRKAAEQEAAQAALDQLGGA